MKATYKIKRVCPYSCWAEICIYIKHKDVDCGKEWLNLNTDDSITPRGARGRVKRIMEAMGITDVKEGE